MEVLPSSNHLSSCAIATQEKEARSPLVMAPHHVPLQHPGIIFLTGAWQTKIILHYLSRLGKERVDGRDWGASTLVAFQSPAEAPATPLSSNNCMPRLLRAATPKGSNMVEEGLCMQDDMIAHP